MSAKIYHNPRCSKSRNTLAILDEKGVNYDVIHYLDTPPNKLELKELLNELGISARELLRTGEVEYKELNLKNESLSEDEILDAMINHPKLIERPIVRTKKGTIIGRPPENVLG
ncbi:MAG: arsenate reductase (glutaredoxin), partial [Gammaproteobacteria bacterium]